MTLNKNLAPNMQFLILIGESQRLKLILIFKTRPHSQPATQPPGDKLILSCTDSRLQKPKAKLILIF